MRPHLSLLLAAALLSACSTTDQGRAVAAVTTPLSDLNLVGADIPAVLREAQRAPYGPPAAADCAGLAAEIAALDEALGPDIDAPPSTEHRGLVERGVDEAHDAAAGALQRTAEGVIPFRGWIRKLSGAERRSRHVAAAITAGGLRRAYLKGQRAAQRCTG